MKLKMINLIRYKLNIGKFGHYFFDTLMNVDLNLEMVLNRLNRNENQITELERQKSYLIKQIKELKGK